MGSTVGAVRQLAVARPPDAAVAGTPAPGRDRGAPAQAAARLGTRERGPAGRAAPASRPARRRRPRGRRVTHDPLRPAGGGGDQGGQARPGAGTRVARRFQPITWSTPSDGAPTGQAARRATRGSRRPGRGRGPAHGRRPGARPRAGPAGPAGARAGAPSSDRHDAGQADDRGRDQGAGPAPPHRAGPWATSGAGHRGRASPSTSTAAAQRHVARGGRQSASRPGRSSPSPVTMAERRRPPREAQAGRLAHDDAGHPVDVERGLAGGEQAAAHVPAAPVLPEGRVRVKPQLATR